MTERMEFGEGYNQQSINDWIFVAKLAALMALLTTGALLALSGSVVERVLGILLLGIMFAHAVELQHQCLHYTAFNGKRLNEIFGFLLGLPLMVSFSAYKVRHAHHHRYVGTTEDSGFFIYGATGRGIGSFLRAVFSLNRMGSLFKAILKAARGEKPDIGVATSPKLARAISREYQVFAILITVAIGMATWSQAWDAVILLWLLPFVVGEAIHFLIEFPEHYGCDVTERSILRNTRSITGSWFGFWLTNGNNFHVEHHMYPKVPIDKLPGVHRQIRDDLAYVDFTYTSFFTRVFAERLRHVGQRS